MGQCQSTCSKDKPLTQSCHLSCLWGPAGGGVGCREKTAAAMSTSRHPLSPLSGDPDMGRPVLGDPLACRWRGLSALDTAKPQGCCWPAQDLDSGPGVPLSKDFLGIFFHLKPCVPSVLPPGPACLSVLSVSMDVITDLVGQGKDYEKDHKHTDRGGGRDTEQTPASRSWCKSRKSQGGVSQRPPQKQGGSHPWEPGDPGSR